MIILPDPRPCPCLPSPQVLEMLAERHPEAGSYHFVEDKMSTLEKVRTAAAAGMGQVSTPTM